MEFGNSIEMLRAAIDASGDGVLLIDPDAGTIVYANDFAAACVGRPREALNGLPVAALGAGFTSGELKAAIDSYPHLQVSETRVRREDGVLADIERRRRAFQFDGRWWIYDGYRDVTAPVRQQRRLRQLEIALNQASDGMTLVDGESLEFVYVNAAVAQMYGVTPDVMMEEGVDGIMRRGGWTSPDAMRERYRAAIDRHPDEVIETFQVRLPGRDEVTLEARRRAVQIDGRWLVIIVGRDVTERERMNRELKQRVEELGRSNKDLEQFAYVSSHDLSEPLRMIGSFTQLLAKRYSDRLDDDGREFVGYITSGAQRMKQLIDDLLTYSRAGRGDTRIEPMDLAGPLNDALANLQQAIADAGATIVRPTAMPTLPCGRLGMMQLFQNLIGNALKFRGEQPLTVWIEASEAPGGWTISVRDNGIGIEPRYFERIFVIFQRLHARTEYEGTGIGLAICKRIVEQHGGRIWVESTPGEGTAFRFFLPAAAAILS